jgi:hypothetical protein
MSVPAALKTYDPELVSVIFGVSEITGFADGTFVKISMPQSYDKVSGVNVITRVKKTGLFYGIELTLQQSSPSNLVLSGLYAIDRGGNGVLPLLVKDGSGNTIVTFLTAWIEKAADISFGTGHENYVWTLCADDNALVVWGGNAV